MSRCYSVGPDLLAPAAADFIMRPSGLLVPPAAAEEAWTNSTAEPVPAMTFEQLRDTFRAAQVPLGIDRETFRELQAFGWAPPSAELAERQAVKEAERALWEEYWGWRQQQGMTQPTPAHKRLLSRWAKDCQDLPQLVEAWMLGR